MFLKSCQSKNKCRMKSTKFLTALIPDFLLILFPLLSYNPCFHSISWGRQASFLTVFWVAPYLCLFLNASSSRKMHLTTPPNATHSMSYIILFYTEHLPPSRFLFTYISTQWNVSLVSTRTWSIWFPTIPQHLQQGLTQSRYSTNVHLKEK